MDNFGTMEEVLARWVKFIISLKMNSSFFSFQYHSFRAPFPYMFSSSFYNYICFQHVTRFILLASCMSLPIITEVDKEHKGNKSKLPTDKGSSPAEKKLLEESLLSDRTSSGKPGSFTF